jgi:hypothetical protein
MPTPLYTVCFLYSEEVIICYQCHFSGFYRFIVYSVFGVGAEIPKNELVRPNQRIIGASYGGTCLCATAYIVE